MRETTRAINELGACGAQIFTNVDGKPLDRPEFRPFFAAMEKLDKPIWVHPSRSANFPDYLDEKKSLYEIWWTFGWAYETAAMMSRLVFSKILDDMPEAEDHRASLRRDRADAGRPRRPRAGISSARAPRMRITARCSRA